MRKRKFILFLIVFLIVFRVLGKNSNLRGRKRFTRSLNITLILIVESLNPTEANANQGIIPGAPGFTPQRPLLGPRKRNPMNPNPNPTKPPRLPSGFTKIPHTPLKEQRLAGQGGNGNGKGNPGSNSNPKNRRSESPDQCLNREYYKKKKKKRSDEISKERVLEIYEDFLSRMGDKGYKINVSEDRFLELARDPHRGTYTNNSVFEAKGGLELEANGTVTNLRRPENRQVDLDFVSEYVSSGETVFIDHKGMIDFETLRKEKEVDVSHFPSHQNVAFKMGKDLVEQKKRHLGKYLGPTSIEDVIHVYNFENIENKAEKRVLVQEVRNGAEQAGYTDGDGIIFLNID